MLPSFLKIGQKRSSLLSMQNNPEFLIKTAKPKNLKNLWGLVVGNVIALACLGALLAMMNKDAAHLALIAGVAGGAAAITALVGYICWLTVQWSKYKACIIGGIGTLKQAVMVSDENGDALFTNAYFKNQFGNLEKNAARMLTDQFIAADMQDEFSKTYAAAMNGSSSASILLMTSKEGGKMPWSINIHPIAEYKNYMFWVLEPIHDPETTATLPQNPPHAFLNFYKVFEFSPLGIVLLDAKGIFLASNKFFREQIFHNEPLQEGGDFFNLLHENCREEIISSARKVIQGEKLHLPIEISFKNHQSQVLSVFIGREQSHHPSGPLEQGSAGITLHFVDNAEQKKLHLQLVQSQKMQAMGQLAGGIAHDFNNLLTAMIGFCDLLLLKHSPGDQSFIDIMQIKQNANRAANLVRQLLAFSKQQTLQPQIFNVVDGLRDLSVLLQRLIGVNIHLDISHGRDLGLIKVDRGQFEQVIINLVVNARDAMNSQGGLSIKTFNKHPTKAIHINHEILPAGPYVVMEIADTGSGIQKEHLPRIFDPFFSTKEVGQGTGLGLSTVYGIVKQTGGYIFVDSVVGKGTKFSLFLPSYQPQDRGNLPEATGPKLPAEDLTGVGTILFVEDEEAVRLFATRALRDKGYRVVEASNGQEALEYIRSLVHKTGEKIDLLITDVVMPALDGPTLIKKAHEIFPELKVIYISGYAEDSFRQRVGQEEDIHFLSKPFSLKELALKVKDVMHRLPDVPSANLQNEVPDTSGGIFNIMKGYTQSK